MRINDWSSYVCSSDLRRSGLGPLRRRGSHPARPRPAMRHLRAAELRLRQPGRRRAAARHWPPGEPQGRERDAARCRRGHEKVGAAYLARWFGPAVTAPVAQHVAAKRYLCQAEDGYFARLSEESVRSLAVQGGPFTAKEAEIFLARPYAEEAVALRRWDELAKDQMGRAHG